MLFCMHVKLHDSSCFNLRENCRTSFKGKMIFSERKMGISKIYSRISVAQTDLGPWTMVLAKGSSSHPGWIMHKMTCRDHDDSSN